MEEIINKVSEVYGCNPYKNTRKREAVWARQVVYVSLKEQGYTTTSLAREFKKNHATVIYAINKHNEIIGKDKQYTLLYYKLLEEINKKKILFLTDNPHRKEFYKKQGYAILTPHKTLKETVKILADCNLVLLKEMTAENKIITDLATNLNIKVIYE